jgi:hypothetical protein
VREEVENGKLVQRKIHGHELKRSVSMVSLKGFQPAPTRAFISYILSQKEALQELAIAGI